MQKLRIDRFAAVAGLLVLSAAVIAYACTTKSASLVGRVSTVAAPASSAVVPAGGTAPAGSACQANGESCYYFEIMSATDADGKALADLTGKTMKAKCAKNVAMPAGWTKETIIVAKADLDWDKQMIQIASLDAASEEMAVAAKANWEKFAVATAGTMAAGGKAGCCAGAAAASAKGASCASKATGASASSGACAGKADAATASSGKGSCAGKADGATASSGKGSCAGKADGATASGKGSCHSKDASAKEASAAAARALVLNVSGMTCGGCASKVEKALLAVKGVSNAKVDLEAHNAKVDVAKEVKAEDLVKAVEAVGFKAEIAAAPAEAAPAKG
jgi:copper chaperone CopZ